MLQPIHHTRSSGGDSNNKAGMIVALTFMAVIVAAAAVGAGWAYKTGRIGGSQRNQQYITEDYPEAGAVCINIASSVYGFSALWDVTLQSTWLRGAGC